LIDRPLSRGQLIDYGLEDLFFLVYLQGQTGELILKAKDKRVYRAFFRNGILCCLVTPETDMRVTLPFFKMPQNSKLIALKERALKRKIPLIDFFIKKDCFGSKELKFGYLSELKKVFKEIPQDDILSFFFNNTKLLGFNKVPEMLENEFALFDSPLKESHFIWRCLRLNTVREEAHYHVMARGAQELPLSQSKTYQEVMRLFKVLGKYYDRIVIDAPALNEGQNSVALSQLTDGTVFVVDKDLDQIQSVIKSIHKLMTAEVNLVGTVLSGPSIQE